MARSWSSPRFTPWTQSTTTQRTCRRMCVSHPVSFRIRLINDQQQSNLMQFWQGNGNHATTIGAR